MIRESDLAQLAYEEMTRDLFLSAQGRLRHRHIAERIAKAFLRELANEREMYDRRTARVVKLAPRKEAHA